MLINHLAKAERERLHLAVEAENDAATIEFISAIVWTRLLQNWDKVIWRFWILKTLRYRDLEPVWVKLFGPKPVMP